MIQNFQLPEFLRNRRFWLVALSVLSAFLLIYLLFGFTVISTNKDVNTIYINGNKFSNVKSVKLRPGIYTVETTTKDTSPYSKKLFALPFIPIKIQLNQVQPFDTFVNARNAPSDAKDHTVVTGSFMNDGYWYVGSFKTTDGSSFYTAAVQYVYGEWQIQKIIPSDNVLSDDLTMLPTNVAAAFSASAKGNELD
jgi:hypothetical protein